MKVVLRAILFVGVLAVLGGCRLFPPRTIGPGGLDYADGLLLADAREKLQARNPAADTFGAQADVAIKARRLPGKENFLVTIRRKKPNRLLIRAHKGPNVLAFQYLQVDDRVALYFPLEQRLFTGTLEMLRKADSPLSRLNPDLVVQALLVESLLLEVMADDENAAWKEGRRDYRLSGRHGEFQVECVIRKKDLLTRRVTLRDAKGRKIGRADYEEYGRSKERLFPKRLEVIDYAGGTVTTIRVHEDSLMVGETFPDAMFNPQAWRLPADVRVLPLSRLMTE